MQKSRFINFIIAVFLPAILFSNILPVFAQTTIEYEVNLKEGEKIEIRTTTKELYLKDIDSAGTVTFFVESKMVSLSPGQSQNFDGIAVYLTNSSSIEKKATFKVNIEAKPTPIPPPPSQLTAEHTADKIVTHGYALIDAYIKELSGFTCTFPNGMFLFFLENNARVNISPACALGKIWREISLIRPDGSAQMIILDGPVSGEPGTPNPEAIADAKASLTTMLSEANMIAIIKNKETVEEQRFNLRLETDFQRFVDTMYATIKLSKPLARGPTPMQLTLPPDAILKVNPADTKGESLTINNSPTSSKEVKVKVDFAGQEKEIKIEVDKIKQEARMEIDANTITTSKRVEVKESKLYFETGTGFKEIRVSPSVVFSRIPKITTFKRIELKEESQKPVYSILGVRQAKLLFIIPVTMNFEARIDAENGSITYLKQPWWSFLARQ